MIFLGLAAVAVLVVMLVLVSRRTARRGTIRPDRGSGGPVFVPLDYGGAGGIGGDAGISFGERAPVFAGGGGDFGGGGASGAWSAADGSSDAGGDSGGGDSGGGDGGGGD